MASVSLHFLFLLTSGLPSLLKDFDLTQTSCHKLVHEDHDTLTALNVTEVGDGGYNETTRFIDTIEPRYLAARLSDDDC